MEDSYILFLNLPYLRVFIWVVALIGCYLLGIYTESECLWCLISELLLAASRWTAIGESAVILE